MNPTDRPVHGLRLRFLVATMVAAFAIAGCGPDPVTFTQGFFAPEPADDGSSFHWMGTEGVIQMKNAGRDMLLTLQAAVPVDHLPQRPHVRIELNGTPLDDFIAAEESIERKFEIPVSRQGTGEHSELRIRTDQTYAPKDADNTSQDVRRLGLVVLKLAWTAR